MSNDDDGNGTARRELGKTLRRIRDLRALSQGDLGALAGTTRNYIASLETGRIEEPSVWRLHALALGAGA